MFASKTLCLNVECVYQNMECTADCVYQYISRFPKCNIITSTVCLRSL